MRTRRAERRGVDRPHRDHLLDGDRTGRPPPSPALPVGNDWARGPLRRGGAVDGCPMPQPPRTGVDDRRWSPDRRTTPAKWRGGRGWDVATSANRCGSLSVATRHAHHSGEVAGSRDARYRNLPEQVWITVGGDRAREPPRRGSGVDRWPMPQPPRTNVIIVGDHRTRAPLRRSGGVDRGGMPQLPRAGVDQGWWRPGTRTTSARWRGLRGRDAATSAKWSRSCVRACATSRDELAERARALLDPGSPAQVTAGRIGCRVTLGRMRSRVTVGRPRSRASRRRDRPRSRASPAHKPPRDSGADPAHKPPATPARTRHTRPPTIPRGPGTQDRPRSRADPAHKTAHEPARTRHAERLRSRGPERADPGQPAGSGRPDLRPRGRRPLRWLPRPGSRRVDRARAGADGSRPDRRPDDEGDA